MGALRTVNGQRQCRLCSEWFPATNEHFRSRGSGRLRGECRPCETSSKTTYNREWRKQNPGRHAQTVRRYQLKRDYGLTEDQYRSILAEQGDGCAICGSKTPGGIGRFPVDHDHETGQTRGILCTPCNRGLGYFRDNSALLIKAAEYLKESI